MTEKNEVKSNVKVGSGVLSRRAWNELRRHMCDAYRRELSQSSVGGKPGFSKKRVDDLVAGFESGLSNAVHHLKEMEVLRWHEDEEADDQRT